MIQNSFDVIVPHSPDLIINNNIFCNDAGYVRLFFVQTNLGLHSCSHDVAVNDRLVYIKQRYLDRFLLLEDLQTIEEQYIKWRDQRELIPMKYTYAERIQHFGAASDLPANADKKEIFRGCDVVHWKDKHGLDCSYWKGVWFDWFEHHEFKFNVTPKRGNDVYTGIVKKRFEPALSAPNTVFFDPAWGEKSTPMLYVTVTVDPKLMNHDIGNAWLQFGKMWNSFITNLRNQYDCKISYVRSWQAQNNYSPHAHVLLYFHSKEFTVVPWVDKDGNQSFRLPSRSHDREAIKKAWKWGNCDIQCVADTQTAYKDLLKYVLHDLEGGEANKTNAMVWFFEKRAFAISGDYFNILRGAMSEPDIADLILPDRDNSNYRLVRIDIYPIMGADLVSDKWQSSLIEGDPPPDLVNFFGEMEKHLEAHECKQGRLKSDEYKVYLWEPIKKGRF